MGAGVFGVLFLLAWFVDNLFGGGEIARNVEVSGVAVGGLGRDEAAGRLQRRARDLLRAPITVQAEGEQVKLEPAQLGVRVDTAAAARGAAAARNTWNPVTWTLSWFVTQEAPFRGVDVPAAKAEAVLRPLLQGSETPPVDASFKVTGNKVEVVPSKDGRGLDVGSATAALRRAVLASGRRRSVRVGLTTIHPKVTTEKAEAMGVKEPVSSFTTKFPSGQPRVKNIALIAKMLDGTVIGPGETFSANKAVGPRTEAKGFVKAPVIYGSEFDEDVGGGVSQFATTLFNAAYFAGFPIKEHKAHTFYISRYPVGREATLSYPHPDLVFTNNLKSSVLLKASVGSSSVTVTLFGTKDGREVTSVTGSRESVTEPVVKCQVDSSLPPGKEKTKQGAAVGFTIKVTRTIKEPDAKETRQEFVTVYKPENRIILYNPTPPPPAPAPAPAPAATAAVPAAAAPATTAAPAPVPMTCPGANGKPA